MFALQVLLERRLRDELLQALLAPARVVVWALPVLLQHLIIKILSGSCLVLSCLVLDLVLSF